MIHTHHWHTQLQYLEYVESLTEGRQLIVELGPGLRPFRPATDFVGIRKNSGKDVIAQTDYNGRFHELDLSRDSLPWADGEVDFLYTRHVIEDLDDPVWCLMEIQRVARSGYIETPSPIAELCRGVDAPTANNMQMKWRGYHHHRSIVWTDGTTIQVVPKWPYLEYCTFGESEKDLEAMLNQGALLWNTYHHWDGHQLQFRNYAHELDFSIGQKYGEILDRACRDAVESARRFHFMAVAMRSIP